METSDEKRASTPAPGPDESSLAPTRPATPMEEADGGQAPPSDALVGTVLSGRYKVLGLLGEGGMGAVYLAEHLHMRKRMAIKVLHAEMSRLPEVVTRFEREAMAAAHIDHPNVAAATDFGKLDDGSFFLALEFIEGQNLRDVLLKGCLELGRALHVLRQIAMALVRAHSIGIVHRDLKPENIRLVDREGDPDFVKVLDFGIAKVPIGEFSGKDKSSKPVLTRAGMVYGTPEYMPPEQALGQPVDARADLYSVGIMAYEMLAGKRPFDDESKVRLLGLHVMAPVPPIAEKCPGASVPAEVEAMILKLLAKETADRTPDAKALLEHIEGLLVALVHAERIEPRYAAGVVTLAAPVALGSARLLPASIEASPGARPPSFAEISLEKVGRIQGRTLLLAMGGGALLVLTLVIALFLVSRRKPDEITGLVQGTAESAGSADAPGSALPPIHAPGEQDPVAKEGIKAAARGEYAKAIELLAPFAENPDTSAEVRRTLMNAYKNAGQHKLALREVERLIAQSTDAVEEVEVRVTVRDVAIGQVAPAEAFKLLQDKMGPHGWDVLYDIAYGASGKQYPIAASRAIKLVLAPDARPKMSPSLRVAMDLRTAPGCGMKPFLDEAAKVGDSRALELLRPAARKPQGRYKQDPYLCLKADGSLDKTLSAIEARMKAAEARMKAVEK